MIMKIVKCILFFLTAMLPPAWVDLIWGDFEEGKADDTTTL